MTLSPDLDRASISERRMPLDDQGTATIREVVALVEQARRDALAEIRQLQTELYAKLDLHDTQHGIERRERRGLFRWAVTTIMTGGGVLIALWATLRGA